MTDHTLNDPVLQSLEARLASAFPQVSTVEQQRLLYECAFTAGRRAGVKTVRRWQIATIGLAGVILAVNAFPFTNRVPVVGQHIEVLVKLPAPVITKSVPASFDESPVVRQTVRVALDAWQVRPKDESLMAQSVAHNDQTDSTVRALTVGVLTRQLLE